MLDAMTAEHVEVARAKGLSASAASCSSTCCAPRLIPVITILAVNIGWLISGSVVVESVFSVAGLGHAAGACSVHARLPGDPGSDRSCSRFMVLGVSLLADLAYAFIDRRVRP